MIIATHLVSTYKMILSAFPKGISEEDYLVLLKVLYLEMSDRNIVDVMTLVSSKPRHTIQNDLYRVATKDMDCTKVIQRLKENGYDEWLIEL